MSNFSHFDSKMLLLLKFSIILFFVQSIHTQPGPFNKSAITSGPINNTSINTTTANTTTTNGNHSTNIATDSATIIATDSANTTNTTEGGTKVGSPLITTISNGPAPENEPEENTITRIPRILTPPQNCTEERHCKAACGSRVDASQCIDDTGNCLCIRLDGPPRRCRNVRPISEMFCLSICAKRVAQICHSDFGNFCTCFLRN